MLKSLLFSLISISNIEKNLRDYLFTDYSSATRPSPDNKPICENIVPVCMVPTNPPSVQWRSINEVSKY